MQNKLLLANRLDQRLLMNQQLTQAITLLQTSTLELKQTLLQYLETSFLLETEESDADSMTTAEANEEQKDSNDEVDQLYNSAELQRSSKSANTDQLDNYSSHVSLSDHLLEQTLLCKFTQREQIIAENIIHALNDDGYLTMSLDDLTKVNNEFSISTEEIEKILISIQSFDPAGVAARDLRECLLLQLREIPSDNVCHEYAKTIICDHFELLTKHKFTQLLNKLNMSESELNQALTIIRSLNPKPGRKFTIDDNHIVEPEVIVKKCNGKWTAILADSVFTKLQINQTNKELIFKNKRDASYQTLLKELQEAEWLIKSIHHRNQTLLAVANYIVQEQYDFFEIGAAGMKPMNISDAANYLNMHESTISRITNGKYLAINSRIFELKYFFPSYVHTESGDTCSDTSVKELIKTIIDNEPADKAYSDDEITLLLKQKGINIARRTVAKYRIAMKILPSYQRRQQY